MKTRIEEITQQVVPVLQKYNVEKAALFGSYARGDYDEKSDIDILIQPPKGMGLGFVRLKRELEQSLDKSVDLVSYNGISPYLQESILKNEQRIL